MLTRFLIALPIPLAVLGCSLAPEPTQALEPAPSRLIFRGDDRVEMYDFQYMHSDSGTHAGVVMVDCSDDRFLCFVGVSVLVAPRHCSQIDALLRQDIWQSGPGGWAQLLFRAANGDYFFQSSYTHFDKVAREAPPSGFVYRAGRGIVGVWHVKQPNEALSAAAPPTVRYLEPGQSALPCVR